MKCEGCFRVVGETTLVFGSSEAVNKTSCCHGNRQLGWVRTQSAGKKPSARPVSAMFEAARQRQQPSCQFSVLCATTQSAKLFPDLCNKCFSHNSETSRKKLFFPQSCRFHPLFLVPYPNALKGSLMSPFSLRNQKTRCKRSNASRSSP